MPKEIMEQDKAMAKKLKASGLEKYELYDVLVYLMRKHTLQGLARELGLCLSDQVEHLYAGMYQDEGGHIGLAAARAVDACAVLTEALRDKAKEYKL